MEGQERQISWCGLSSYLPTMTMWWKWGGSQQDPGWNWSAWWSPGNSGEAESQMSRLMRLWHLSPSVNPIFKHACAAIHWRYTSDFWSDPSSTSILHVCEQRRLCSGETAWMRSLAWAFAVRLCDKYHNLMSWLKWYGHISRSSGMEKTVLQGTV